MPRAPRDVLHDTFATRKRARSSRSSCVGTFAEQASLVLERALALQLLAAQRPGGVQGRQRVADTSALFHEVSRVVPIENGHRIREDFDKLRALLGDVEPIDPVERGEHITLV